jgi:hypothetical protein
MRVLVQNEPEDLKMGFREFGHVSGLLRKCFPLLTVSKLTAKLQHVWQPRQHGPGRLQQIWQIFTLPQPAVTAPKPDTT